MYTYLVDVSIFTVPVNYYWPVNMNNGIIQFAIIEFHKYINQIKSRFFNLLLYIKWYNKFVHLH